MAIIRENFDEAGTLIRTYSDLSMLIRQVDTGILYVEAMDPADSVHTYEETDEPIPVYPDTPTPEPVDPDEATVSDYEAALKRLGVSE